MLYFVAKQGILQQKCLKNRNLPARNRLVQLLTLYTDPVCHDVRQTDRQMDGRRDNIMIPRANHTACTTYDPLKTYSVEMSLAM